MKKGKLLWFGIFLIALLPIRGNALAVTQSILKKASDFTVKSLSGKNIKLSEQRGRVVILNFWATWCTPCKKELPYFNDLYGKYKTVGLEILGVNIDKTTAEARRMSNAFAISFPVLLDPSGKVSDLYGIRSMPTTYVIGKGGMVRHIHWGFGPDEPGRYEKEIRSLLKE
ncbi:MAG: peroxiredoxin family protein [Nitrospiria bacterium]